MIEWIQFVFMAVLLVLVPKPVTQVQWVAFVIAVVLLVLMAVVLFGLLGGAARYD